MCWVNWKIYLSEQFGTVSEALGAANLTPDNPNGFDLVGYTDDQWSATVGVGLNLMKNGQVMSL